LKPILILGGSGFIGNCLYNELVPYFNTFGTYNSALEYSKNQHFFSFNAEKDSLEAILKEVKPKLIISALRGNFNAQLEAHEYLVNYIKNKDCRILFLSSANVFDSFQHFPSYEYDKTLSESIYGNFKIKIENMLLRLAVGKYIIARLPMVFGLNAPRTLEIDRAVKNNMSIEVFPNTIINVNSDIRLSQQIHYLINQKKTGLYHLGSSDLISHYDFIKIIVEKRHHTLGIFKQVYTSNTMRYLATLPKENKLPNHLLTSYTDVINDLTLTETGKQY
jgi:dTDP-4-dehydrorhamnose reductase|tara:strand:+ start:7018 stop:7848 length:831 start_codon:yes stop_codon:yes gene_type:complete